MSSKDEYIEKMKNQLDEWNKDIDRLEAQISEVQSSAKEQLQTRLKQAREGYETAKEKLEEIRAGGEESWEKARDEIEHVGKVLKQSINYFRSRL